MGLKETLALVITADVKGAVSGLEAVGQSADKNLGKTNSSLEKTGGKLTSTGAAMVGFGAIALVGLGHAAMAAEDANKSTLKLQNSMANNQSLAGQSTKAFEDLATSIMNKTAADDDDIISGEAVLAQMGLTGDQITNLTPLVVDLSRKMGVDMDTAAKTVAKSVDGSSGALKKMGIQVDQTKFKTDAYGATMDALKNSVGGFAETEGKTFSGQIERMGNQLHNLEEGVGVGVVKAFGSMFSVVEKVTGAFEALSPGAQGTIGQFATYGAVALTAIGATSALVGMLTTAAARFGLKSAATAADTAATVSNTGATAANAAAQGAAGAEGLSLASKIGLVGAAVGLAAALWEGYTHSTSVSVNVTKSAQASTDELVKGFHELGGSTEYFTKLAEGSIGTAQRLRDALAAQGRDTSKLDEILHQTSESNRQLSEDQKAGTAAAEAEAKSEANLAAQLTAATKQMDLQRTAQDSLIGSNISLDQAQLATEDSLNKVMVAQAAVNQAQGVDALVAQEDLRKSVLDAAGAIDTQAQATAANMAKQDAANGVTDSAAQKHQNYVNAISILAANLAPDSPVRQYLEQYIAQLNAIPASKTTRVNVVGSGGIPVAGAFAEGGFVPGPKGKAQLAVVHGGEYVIPTSDIDRARHGDSMKPVESGRIVHIDHVSIVLEAGLKNGAQLAREIEEHLATV